MWLIQAGRLARKEPPPRGLRLPSLERLSSTAGRCQGIAAWTAAAGFVSGIVLNAVNRRRGLLETVPWTDPVVLRMATVVAWLVAAAVVVRVTGRRVDGPRIAARVALVSFAVLTASILWGIFGASRHGVPATIPADGHEPLPAAREAAVPTARDAAPLTPGEAAP
jgi:hypothetical protein